MKKLAETFTATHFTILALGAMFVPTALYGVTAFTNVAIEDPTSGRRATVSSIGQVFTYNPVADPIAAYGREPKNFVDVPLAPPSLCSSVYDVPSGKALVVTAMTGAIIYNQNNNYIAGGVELYDTSDCSGRSFGSFYSSVLEFTPMNVQFGNGVALLGRSLYAKAANNVTSVLGNVHGYLVPASAVPAPNTALAAETHPVPTSRVPPAITEARARH